MGLSEFVEGLIARLVAVGMDILAFMTRLMLLQPLTIRETLFATSVGTDERAFSCMRLHVSLQSFPLSECPTARTILTGQKTLLVCAVMLNQSFTIMESSAARVIYASKDNVCLEMLIQCFAVVESPAATLVLACERSLICMGTVVLI